MIDRLLATRIGDTTLAEILTIEWLISLFGNLLVVILILVAAVTISGWAKRHITGFAQRHERIDKTLFSFFGNVARWAILAVAATFVLNRFGVQATSIVALIGAAGLAIGLALQGTLTNLAAGVMLVIFRPIRVGDFVQVGEQSGTVMDISLMTTELATVGNFQVIMPNNTIWNSPILNFSVYPRRRAEWVFGVAYGADLGTAERIIREVLASDTRTIADPPVWLQVNNLGEFSVDFLVRAWVDREAFWDYQADIKRRVKEAFDANGVEIPFPTRTLYPHRPLE